MCLHKAIESDIFLCAAKDILTDYISKFPNICTVILLTIISIIFRAVTNETSFNSLDKTNFSCDHMSL